MIKLTQCLETLITAQLIVTIIIFIFSFQNVDHSRVLITETQWIYFIIDIVKVTLAIMKMSLIAIKNSLCYVDINFRRVVKHLMVQPVELVELEHLLLGQL